MATDISYLPPECFEGLPRSKRRFASSGEQLPYFYLPCTLCGELFGGYEWNDVEGHRSSVPDSDPPGSGGRGICMNCTVEGRGCLAWGHRCGGVAHEYQISNIGRAEE